MPQYMHVCRRIHRLTTALASAMMGGSGAVADTLHVL